MRDSFERLFEKMPVWSIITIIILLILTFCMLMFLE
jgi:hypothetical protein